MPTEEYRNNGAKISLRNMHITNLETGEETIIENTKALIQEIEPNEDDKYTNKIDTNGELSFTLDIKDSKEFMKLMGLNRVSKKKMKKLLMGYGLSRNRAEVFVKRFQKYHIERRVVNITNLVNWLLNINYSKMKGK